MSDYDVETDVPKEEKKATKTPAQPPT